MEGFLVLVLSSIAVIIISQLLKVLLSLIWRPYAITKWYRQQGIQGPKYQFMKGSIEEIRNLKSGAQNVPMDINSHDFTPRTLPHYLKWISLYGRTFLFWFGSKPRICITDMELVKQVLSNKSGFYPKADAHPGMLALLGKGLVMINGPDWARHRRVVNPAFTIDKLKMMTRKMTGCAKSMIEGWENQIAQEKSKQIEIELNKQFLELTADVISLTAFGSSYMKGKEVFLAQKELQALAFASFLNVQIPGFQYLPTPNNRKGWCLDKKIRTTLMQIIHERMKSRKDEGYGKDLLGLMLETCMVGGKENDNNRMTMDEIIDECKTFFFGGHETTSHLLTWTMFLLSTNEDWQEKLREEVLRECGMAVPNADMLSKLKLVNMVLLEALRIYGPVNIIFRKASQDMELGTIKLLKGTSISIPFAILHRDKEIWGPDADKFNPLRFENGLSKAAKHPNALLSFSIGPRGCIGQNFAMLEAKAVIAMLLQRFCFSISPNYVHEPIAIITLQPKSGLQVIMRPIQA
ncbi:Cytochrome P450 [Rhynchospora pubera]|uniref:Cytochrome P450 n=1 Tax=Rhynchospora pubera TaxID=906938 RepID=A0AAV8AKK6_9POAL|nr:Cytochrome P450 [Rhynchospora pubera]KAJ4755239.1 Cytochrome P450 [Rhynchospora pubera]